MWTPTGEPGRERRWCVVVEQRACSGRRPLRACRPLLCLAASLPSRALQPPPPPPAYSTQPCTVGVLCMLCCARRGPQSLHPSSHLTHPPPSLPPLASCASFLALSSPAGAASWCGAGRAASCASWRRGSGSGRASGARCARRYRWVGGGGRGRCGGGVGAGRGTGQEGKRWGRGPGLQRATQAGEALAAAQGCWELAGPASRCASEAPVDAAASKLFLSRTPPLSHFTLSHTHAHACLCRAKAT
jgi:hypothetical protein